MKNTITISGIEFITPAVDHLGSLSAWCATYQPLLQKTVENIKLPADIKMQEQRRMAKFSRLALYAAIQASESAKIRGRDGGLFISLTHSSASLLKEFHDFLFDYGPELASPNAFSNGVTGAPLGVVSKYLGLTLGGSTIVGYEQAGLDLLGLISAELNEGLYPVALVGAAEEYSAEVEAVYTKLGWFGVAPPASLPCTETGKGFGIAEAGVCLACEPVNGTATAGCCYTPINDLSALDMPIDCIISGACGGRQDQCELDALRASVLLGKKSPALVFSKPFFGETFAAGALLSVAAGYDMLVNGNSYPQYTPHPDLTTAVDYSPMNPGGINTILVIAGSRSGEISAGLLSRKPL